MIGKIINTTSHPDLKVIDKILVDGYTKYLCMAGNGKMWLIDPAEITFVAL